MPSVNWCPVGNRTSPCASQLCRGEEPVPAGVLVGPGEKHWKGLRLPWPLSFLLNPVSPSTASAEHTPSIHSLAWGRESACLPGTRGLPQEGRLEGSRNVGKAGREPALSEQRHTSPGPEEKRKGALQPPEPLSAEGPGRGEACNRCGRGPACRTCLPGNVPQATWSAVPCL